MTRRTLLQLAGVCLLPQLSFAQRGSEDLQRGASFLDVANLVNEQHPLARRLVAWWLYVPQRSGGGTQWYDLVRNRSAVMANMPAISTATGGWGRTTRRQGGYGEMRYEGTMSGTVSPFKELDAIPAFTWSVWAKRTAINQVGGLFQKWVNGTFSTGLFTYSDGQLYFRINGVSSGSVLLAMGTIMPAGVWTHLTAVFDGTLTGNTQRAKIYFNSTLATTGSSGGIPALTADHDTQAGATVPLLLGRNLDSTVASWVGALDDMRVWTRALSAAEIRELYVNSQLGYPGLLRRLPLTAAPAAVAAARRRPGGRIY